MRGKYMLSNARTKAHIYSRDSYSLEDDDEDDVIFLKKGATLKDSPQSIMHTIAVPEMVPLKLPEPIRSQSAREEEREEEDLERTLFSSSRLPIKLSDDAAAGVHSRMARYEKLKARSLSQKYWTRVRAVKKAMRADPSLAMEEEEEAEEQWKAQPAPVRASSKVREKARRADRRNAREAKCASWLDNELTPVSFAAEVSELPESRFMLVDRPVIYVHVTPQSDPRFQELLAKDHVIGVPRIPTKMGGSDEIGVHSRMARREKKTARELSKKHWSRVRAVKRAARAGHAGRDRDFEEGEGEGWPPAPQYTKAGLKARRIDRCAARDAKCASWYGNEAEETVVFAAKPEAKKAKESRPWVSRTELPASVQVIDPEFKALVDTEVHVAVEADAHYRMAKQSKKSGRELSKKFWSRKREAKAAHAKLEASLPGVDEEKADESEEEGAPIRSSYKLRSKARRAARRDARDAKCAAWADEDSAGHVVFPNKGWLEAVRPETSVVRDIMYEDASSASAPTSPTSTVDFASRLDKEQVSRARLKLSFGDAVRLKPISSIYKARETGYRARRRTPVGAA